MRMSSKARLRRQPLDFPGIEVVASPNDEGVRLFDLFVGLQGGDIVPDVLTNRFATLIWHPAYKTGIAE